MSAAQWHIPTSEEEVVDVFFEEVGDLLANIDGQLSAWKSNLRDKKALTEIRRSFHTLKGSGRMVKAMDLSEVAWKVENMLNQAIAGTVPVSGAMVDCVTAARLQMPRLLDAFRSRRSIAENPDVVRLARLADSLASGRKAAQSGVAPRPVSAGGGARPAPSDLNLKLERFMQRADEALHRSEMALQQTRRIARQNEAANRDGNQRAFRADVDRISERLDSLSKAVSDARLEIRTSERDSVRHRNAMSEIAKQRARSSPAPTELLLNEIKRDIEETSRSVSRLRRDGWFQLIAGAAAGGVISAGLLLSILTVA